MRNYYRKLILIIAFAFVIAIGFYACKKEQAEISEKTFGLQQTPASQLASIPFAAPKEYSGTIPTQKFLETPPPEEKGQGSEGSCVGWALAYGLKSYHYHKYCVTNYGADLDYSTVCSPEFLYNLSKIGDCSSGTYFKNAFDILMQIGVCVWTELPYDDNNCDINKITDDLRQKASKHKIKSYELVTNFSTINIKKLILNGYPIVIGAKVDDKFMSLGKNDTWQAPFGTWLGNHALIIDGYDDNKGAFRILNSWGQDWGDGGYTWLKYDHFSTVVFEAYIAESAENCQNPEPNDDLTKGLIAYYPFNGNTNDESGNGNNGTLQGASINTGYKGQGLNLNGNADIMVVPHNQTLNLSTGSYSICFWINLVDWVNSDSYGTYGGYIMLKHKTWDDVGSWSIRIVNGNIAFDIWSRLPNLQSNHIVSNTILSKNQWYFVCVTGSQNDNYTRIYINGNQIDKEMIFFSPTNNSTQPMWFGTENSLTNREIDGSLDEVRFYNRALSTNEIQQLYQMK